MSSRYPSQTFEVYEHPQWPINENPAYAEDASSTDIHDKILDSRTPAERTHSIHSRDMSFVKSEDEYGSSHAWQERPHVMMPAHRHYSQPVIPTVNTHQVYLQSYAVPYQQGWPMPSSSGTSTPTPMFAPKPPGYNRNPVFNFGHGGPVAFQPHPQLQMPDSAISMSPQSSQEGWTSTSSEQADHAGQVVQSPGYCPVSPSTAGRPDGVRKKNARFEIPKDRNLHNIDQLIHESKDDAEKKELKAQKRLLRNRQAALDSRQRKKTHTEKLELEKKSFTDERGQLENTINMLQDTLQAEREAWAQRQQQYEAIIHNLQYEKEEVIRSKTVETTDLRRRNSVLKDHIRDMERHIAVRQYNSESMSRQPTHTSDFSSDLSFGNLDLEDDSWADDSFDFIDQHNEDLKMESASTPRPEPVTHAAPMSFNKPVNATTSDLSFWNTFYMCVLLGAFVATNSTNKSASTSSAVAPSSATRMMGLDTTHLASLPSLTISDDYRHEAGNVLKAVLNAHPEDRSAHHNHHHHDDQPTSSSLDQLHATLTNPTAHQRLASAFAPLSPAAYQHLSGEDQDLDADADGDLDPEFQHHRGPTKLESAMAELQAERDARGLDRILSGGNNGRGEGGRGGVVRVPEKVLRDFREMVRHIGGELN